MAWLMVASDRQKDSSPWYLLGLSGLLCVGLSVPVVRPPWLTPYAGQVQLENAIPGDAPGWQVRLDLRDHPFRTSDDARAVLNQLTKLGDDLPAEIVSQAMDGRVHLQRSAEKNDLSLTPLSPLTGPGRITGDPLFEGSPMAIFEWSRDARIVRGNLYRSTKASRLYSGRLVSVLPFPTLMPPGDDQSVGFQLKDIGFLPNDCERVLSIDPKLIRFPTRYRVPILEAWKRWEFSPFKTLGPSIGPAMTFAKWRGESLFSFALKDSKPITDFIDKRYPPSVIPTTSRWSFGTRVSGFDPDGPAWFLRGDHVVATVVGGTERLDQLMQTLHANEGSFRRDSALLSELQRLSTTESGWHLFVLMADPTQAFQWGALVRWPSTDTSQANGFLVIEIPSEESRKSPL